MRLILFGFWAFSGVFIGFRLFCSSCCFRGLVFGFYVLFFRLFFSVFRGLFSAVFSPRQIRRNAYQQRGWGKREKRAEKKAQMPINKGFRRKNADC
jgi:hypothetical protein